ncbi:MAG: trigger factor [Firmicutes bacterium]|nr:trigger factor [Bacillota bacterium]MCL1953483.1 trigger factor [Bacillota bacterium]
MKYTIDNTNGKRCKVEFSLDNQEWQTALEEAYLANRDRFKIQGFRPGKAPRGIIEKHYGPAVFVEDAINIIFPKLYDKVLEENPNIQPVSAPDLDLATVEPTVVFSAEFDLMPKVVLGKYKGLEIHDIAVEIDDKEIQDQLASEAQKLARKVKVDRPVQLGDIVTFDFSGSVDGVKFDGGTAKDFELEMGSGQFIPGFEDQIVGMAVNEDRDIKVAFPTDYHEKSLAGKDAVFACKVNNISVNQIPEINDAFAKDVSVFDTLEDYKQDLKSKLMATKSKQATTTVDNNLLDMIVGDTKIEIPQSMIDRQIDVRLRDFEMMLSRNNMDLNKYLEMTQSNIKDMRTHFAKDAEKAVKVNLVVEELIKVENIQASDVDIANKLESIAKENNMTIEQVEQAIKDGQLDKEQVVHAAKLDKLQAFIRQHNTILPPKPTENTVSDAKAEPKKTTKTKPKAENVDKKVEKDVKVEKSTEKLAEKEPKKPVKKSTK